MRKCIRLFSVNSPVTNFHLLDRHPKGNAADVLDEYHDQRGPDDVPADDEEGTDDLEPDLLAVASDGTTGVGDTERRATLCCGPETCEVES